MQNKNYGDQKSKILFAKSLVKQGYKVYDADNFAAKKGVTRPDLYAKKDGKIYQFELKQRKEASEDVPDLLISEHKLQLINAKTTTYFVWFFSDGAGFILDPSKKEYIVKEYLTSKTTRLGRYEQNYEKKVIFQKNDAQTFRFEPKKIYSEFDLELARLKRERKQKRAAI